MPPVLSSRAFAVAGVCALFAGAGHADGGGIEWSGSGFLTLAAGKMLGGTRGSVAGHDCPCFVADYGQGGVYDGRSGLQWKPDSKFGLQGTGALPDQGLSLTAQVVARGARDGKVNLEWLYGSYQLDSNLTLQVGRKRLPMFYYSDIQDVGFTLPWTHLPEAVYGWEAVNYNGVNLLHRSQLGGWAATLNVLAGREHRQESGYWKIYNGPKNRTDIRWDSIVGGDLTLARAWFETRLVYIQSRTQERNVNGSWDAATQSYDPATIQPDFPPAARQKIFGAAFNADYRDWIVRTEFVHITRPGATFKDFAQTVAVGYRLGRWQPMATWSNYRADAVVDQGGRSDAQEAWTIGSLTLRYDLGLSSALKVQYDRQRSRSGPNYPTNFGDARLLTISYDLVF